MCKLEITMKSLIFNQKFRKIHNFSEELHEVHKNIFNETSSVEDKQKGLSKLRTWKLRTGQDTQSGILCTLILLEVHLKDVTKEIRDRSTLTNLYANSFIKFINFATAFQMNEATMYRSAYKLGLESFLIDLRHLCAHGKVTPSLEVFRRSMKICFDWIDNFYWKREIENVSDANAIDMRKELKITQTLQNIFILYDSLVELLHNNVLRIEDEGKSILLGRERLEKLETFFKKIETRKFHSALGMLTRSLKAILGSKQMTQNPSTFFHEMISNCPFFLTTSAEDNQSISLDETINFDSELDSSQDSSTNKKKARSSIVSLYQDLIWEISRQGYLKEFVRELHVINSSESEDSVRKESAGFWISTILNSFQCYQKYLEFTQESWTKAKKITHEVRRIYTYQLDADLRKTFIFVGTQMTQSSLKYSMEYFQQMLKDLNEDNVNVLLSILPFVHPPLTPEQLEQTRNLIKIKILSETDEIPNKPSKIFTLEDLNENGGMAMDVEDDDHDLIWQVSLDDIDWKSQPIGKDVSHLQD